MDIFKAKSKQLALPDVFMRQNQHIEHSNYLLMHYSCSSILNLIFLVPAWMLVVIFSKWWLILAIYISLWQLQLLIDLCDTISSRKKLKELRK